jgi:mono/diheme cytochrome c family protein
VRWCLLVIVAIAASGCEKLARNMYDGAKLRPLQARATGGQSTSMPVPEGIVERTSAGTAEAAQHVPYPVTDVLLARGRERFEIYCAPCHSPLGDGDGMVARRGFPHPPDYRLERLRRAPDRHFYDVMTQGYGVMYSYADRVSPQDRWAIVAWIRALQAAPVANASTKAPAG